MYLKIHQSFVTTIALSSLLMQLIISNIIIRLHHCSVVFPERLGNYFKLVVNKTDSVMF